MTASMIGGIDALIALQKDHELYINKLGEPIAAQLEQQQSGHDGARSSDVSSAVGGSDIMTPASLAADLEHYKELFTKLRFSYVEQTTKEKFLRAVVGEPPIYVTPDENAELEAHLSTVKATLKAQKTEVVDLVAGLERQSRDLSRRHEKVRTETEMLQAYPAKIAELQAKRDHLRQLQAQNHAAATENLPLADLRAMLGERRAQVAAADEQMAESESELVAKTDELIQLREELEPLKLQSASVGAVASDGMDSGHSNVKSGVSSNLEVEGRWLRGVEATMRAFLEVDA